MNFLFTVNDSKRPTIDVSTDTINIFHLAWQENDRDVFYLRLKEQWVGNEQKLIPNNGMSPINISAGSGFTKNHSPSLISIKDNSGNSFALVSWIGEREDYPQGITPITQKQVVLTSTATPGIFKTFGEDINSVSINKCPTRWTLGWARSNDMPIQYTDSRGNSIYQLELYGKDVQISNGNTPEQMYALAFKTKSLPYTINTKQIYPRFVPEEIIATTKCREGVVSKSDAQIYYNIGEIEVNGEKIDFVEMSDTTTINTLSDINRYLISEPFAVDDNSEFYYTIRFGISDSSEVKQALTDNEYVSFKVELIDANTNDVLGVLDEVTYDQHNVAQYDNVAYQVNTSGIGNRIVKLLLVISTNICPYYAISEKYFEEANSLAKKQFKQINYKGKQEIKEYALYQNYPNPFNPTTRIKYSVKEDKLVTIKLYDMLGREVATLLNEVKSPGEYVIELDGQRLGLSSGVYLYQMKSGDFSSIKKLVFVK